MKTSAESPAMPIYYKTVHGPHQSCSLDQGEARSTSATEFSPSISFECPR